MVEAVKRGFPQREIADAAFTYQQEVESGLRKIVGVNAYTEGDDAQTPILKIDPAFETHQVQRVRALREPRDARRCRRRWARSRSAARDERANLMPHLIDAARADVTEGEMVQTLQSVFGTYRETPAF